MLNVVILIVGASGIIAQVAVLRELLVGFYGNELIMGVVLANWILSEALGAYLVGRAVSSRNAGAPESLFVFLQLVFSVSLVVSLYAARVFKAALGIPPVEAVGLTPIFLVSGAINFPVAFSHGGLFSCLCRMQQAGSRSVGKTYVWETKGTMLGGLAFTYLLVPFFTSFQIAAMVVFVHMAVCLFYFTGLRPGIQKQAAGISVLLIALVLIAVGPGRLQSSSIRIQWKGARVLDYRNSVYGNIVVTGREEQYTFYYNGLPLITVPDPDVTFAEEFGSIPLLCSGAPAADILVIGGGAGGVLEQILRHPVKRLDYAQIDPQIIDTLKRFPTALTKRELEDSRVTIIPVDGRFFLKNTSSVYDVILLGFHQPADLTVNRIFTEEFFFEARMKLARNGVLAFCLPGSSAYMGRDLRDVNACVYRAAQRVFGSVRVIPGELDLYLASDDPALRRLDAGTLAGRVRQRNIQSALLTPEYLAWKLDAEREKWFLRLVEESSAGPNRDFTPRAVFHMMLYWNKQFSDPLIRFFERWGKSGGFAAALAVFCVYAGAAVFLTMRRRRKEAAAFALVYSILTTGFFSMLVTLMCIFIFQSVFGYLYYKIGLLISLFMAGTAAGGMIATSMIKRLRAIRRFYLLIEMLIIVFTAVFAVIPSPWLRNAGQLFFSVLFIVPGLLTGLAFPLAGALYAGNEAEKGGKAAGVLYGADLLGGWFAGMAGGVILLPLVGLAGTFLIIAALKLSSFIAIYSFRKKL